MRELDKHQQIFIHALTLTLREIGLRLSMEFERGGFW